MFKYVNEKEDRIRRCNVVIEILEENLTGVEKLHEAYLRTGDERVTEILGKGLAEIYSCGSETIEGLKVKLQVDFIDGTLKLIQEFS